VHRIPVTIQSGPVAGVGYIKNISKGGMFARSELTPHQGASVRIAIHTSTGKEIELEGVVCWSTQAVPESEGKPQPGFGLQIDPVPQEFLEFFEAVLLN